MLPTDLSKISFEHISQLVETGMNEGKTVEYKAQMYTQTENGRKELCKDISAFANSIGGDLIIGIREENTGDAKGKPIEVTPIIGESYGELCGRITQTVDAHVQPRLYLEFQEVPVEDVNSASGFVLIVRVRQSLDSPHMVRFNSLTKFFVRTSHGVSQIEDVNELRQAFMASETYEERVRNWKLDRIAKIVAGETPVILESDECLVLHIVPLNNFIRNQAIDLFTDSRLTIMPLGTNGTSPRINFEGRLFPSASKIDCSRCYTQLFRMGMMEAVLGGIIANEIDGCGHNWRFLRHHWIETELVRNIGNYLMKLVNAGAGFPFALYVTLLNVQSTYSSLRRGPDLNETTCIKHRHLILPGLMLDYIPENVADTMKPVFDALGNALGYPVSPSYGENGDWDPRRLTRSR